jgi:hypothetical protein
MESESRNVTKHRGAEPKQPERRGQAMVSSA